MTRKQAQFFIICALVVVATGLPTAISSGSALSWFIVAIGAFNTVLGVLLLRRSSKPLD